MTNQAQDEIAEAANESMEQEGWPRKIPKRGKTSYMRRALIRIFAMKTDERLTYTPRNGFEESALAMFNVVTAEKSHSVAAWKEIRETIGEKIGTNWKATMDELEPKSRLSIDIPTADRKQ